MMRFESRDLMADVLPAAKRFAQPGLVLCGQATAGGGGTEEDDELECGQATAGDPDGVAPTEAAALALLRQQLHEMLSAEAQV
jgi:hypothetical protein